MRVLFVCSSNNAENCTHVVRNQGESLKKAGIGVEYFKVSGKGLYGYMKNILPLRRYLKNQSFDLVHAHYWLSGLVASFAGRIPVVVSLMGSDVKQKGSWRRIIRLLNRFSWDACIVKSQDMYNTLGVQGVIVIPNGVDTDAFTPMDQGECRRKLQWDPGKDHILFPSDPGRPEKNYELAAKALEQLDRKCEIHFLQNIPHPDTVLHYNAADVVLMTSLWEGSPNVIKEAMACNCAIVATGVGDVRELFSGCEGCFIAPFSSVEIAGKIKLALGADLHPGGRESILGKKLDAESIAGRIIDLYNQLVHHDAAENNN